MASRIVWRPLTGGILWTGAGIGAGIVAPTALQSWIVSTSIVAASFWGGAVLVLLPLGVVRGVITSVQEICQVHGRPALQQALDSAPSSQFLTTREGNQQLIERLTLGSGWQGRMIRSLASPFLPSTAQMMVRLQELVDKQDNTTLDSQVVVAAVDGFVEGFLQDKKDTVTTLGLLGYAGIVAIGFGLDYTYRRAAEWKNKQDSGATTVTTSHENQNKGMLDFAAIAKKLGLPQTEANKEIEAHWEEQQKLKVVAKENVASKITEDKLFSIRETLDAAQIQVGETIKWLAKGKQQADPYLQQAFQVADAVKEEVGDQASWLFEQAKRVMLDEQNKERFQEHWKRIVATIPDMTMDDKSLARMIKDMEDILRQAKQRLGEDDVLQMRKELEQAIDQAKERMVEEKKRAKVDERIELAKVSIISKIEDWWNGRST